MRNGIKYLIILVAVIGNNLSAQELLLKDYNPVSIYNIPVTLVEKAKYPVIDMHSHTYPTSKEEIDQWVKTMDNAGIEKTILLTGRTGVEFDSLMNLYSKYPERFDLWCGLDFSDFGTDKFIETVTNELERCHKVGATGVGEITDKGLGIYSAFTNKRLDGIHLNNPLLTPIYNKCAELKMPLNIHVAEPYWMYLPVDERNDGLINAAKWNIDLSTPGIRNHEELIADFADAVKKHPKTTFIACHFMNCSYDLTKLAALLDKYPNLYTDISARLGETGSIPRYMNKFITKYADRILYGTDNGVNPDMYHTTFRFLETDDEHFYVPSFHYHWNYSGFNLSNKVLKKIYYKNARKIIRK